MSAFGHKADITIHSSNVSAFGGKADIAWTHSGVRPVAGQIERLRIVAVQTDP